VPRGGPPLPASRLAPARVGSRPLGVSERKRDGPLVSVIVPTYDRAAIVPRRSIEAVGPFDERMRYLEDMELFMRLAMDVELLGTAHARVREARQ
jgi:hypothetical protein